MKYRNTTLEINTNNIKHNLSYYQQILQQSTKIIPVIKANAYGHDALQMVNYLESIGYNYFAVALISEAIKLRNQGINSNLIILQPEINSFDEIIKYNFEPTIYNLESLTSLKLAMQTVNKKINTHIKFDTGMHRYGFATEDAEKIITELQKLNNKIFIKSVFSHLAAADEEIHDDYTKLQISKFKEIKHKFEASFTHRIYFHLLNSAGIERHKEAQFDWIRLGIGLYGASENNQNKLKQIATLKTKILQIKTIKAKETVGYNRKGNTKRNTQIAILPIGYADGLSRLFSNGKIEFKLKNKVVKTIGNICMDICMIDITGVDAQIGDEVIIYSNTHNNLTVLSKKINTIPYEIMTGIKRVKIVFE